MSISSSNQWKSTLLLVALELWSGSVLDDVRRQILALVMVVCINNDEDSNHNHNNNDDNDDINNTYQTHGVQIVLT